MNSSFRLASAAGLVSAARLALRFGTRLAAGAALAICGVACESDADPVHGLDAGAQNDMAGTGSGALKLRYAPMFSAFVEGHEAQLPVMLTDPTLRSKGAKFTSSDPNIASVVDTAEGATITIKKDGVVAIRATLEGDFVNTKLTITKFSEAQWKAGQARYAKSELAIVPPDGGTINAVALLAPNGRNPNGACTTCHGAQANTLRIEATPTQTAGYSDQALITIFTMGKKPEDWVQKSTIPAFIWGTAHSWTVTEEEKQGLVAFLRTQPPRPQPLHSGGDRVTCIGADAAAGPMFCDGDGYPIRLPVRDAGLDASAAPMSGEAGAGEPQDAGAADGAG